MDYWSVLEYELYYKKRDNAEIETELKKYADDQEQYVISALMDNYISHYTKAVWMLKQQSV